MELNNNLPKLNYANFYHYSVLIFAFILPLSRAAISFFIILLPIIWLIEGNFKTKLSTIWQNSILKALILFLGFTVFSFFWSEDFDNGLNFLRLYAYFITIFVITTSIKKEYIQIIVTAFLYGMLMSEIIAYGVFFELWEFKYATVQNPSPFMFWIDYSIFMALTSILLLSRLFSKNFTFKEKVFMFLFFLSTTGNLFLSSGRTGQAALIVGIIVMTFLYLRPSIKSFFIGIFLIISIYGVGYTISDTFKVRVANAIADIQMIENNKFDTSLGIRAVYWMITYDILKENFFFGVGIGDYQKTVAEYVATKHYPISKETSMFIKTNHAHNQFLMILIQTGVIGLALMLNVIYRILRFNIRDNDTKILSILFVSIFFVSCMAEPLFFKQFTLVLFILFVSLFAANGNKQIIGRKE